MKKILLSFIGLILSFDFAFATTKTKLKAENSSVQISLQSEPIDLKGIGKLQTIFISPRTVDTTVPRGFGIFADSFDFVIDSNECVTDNRGSSCTEIGAESYIAKFSNSKEELMLYSYDKRDGNFDELWISNGRTGEPIQLFIESVRVANAPGKPYYDLFVVAKDSTGKRKAKLHATLRN